MRKVFSTALKLPPYFGMLLVVIACVSSKPEKLPSPTIPCKGAVASWQGIVPGETTQDQMVNLLGQPVKKEKPSSDGHAEIYLYAPTVEYYGDIWGNKVIFRQDGIVDSLDVWGTTSDGKFPSIVQFVDEYGTTLDTIYTTNSGDVGGPGVVYVWSECGIAFTAVNQTYLKSTVIETEDLSNGDHNPDDSLLVLRHLDVRWQIEDPILTRQQFVVRKFIYQPTNFDNFKKVLMDEIPHISNHLYLLLDLR